MILKKEKEDFGGKSTEVFFIHIKNMRSHN